MNHDALMLPALRGSIGDWIYYSALMRIGEIGSRIQYAEEVHRDKALSELIQRSLEGARAKHIAAYLENTRERFFNSLVLATYGGEPQWLEVGNFESTTKPEILKTISPDAMNRLGFLSFDGSEKIFAIDGQHRLAGIKRALGEGADIRDELVPIILVGHKRSAAGLRRTRRLFTTLNKTAVAVRKTDIIALDEDDVMAIIARRMVETNASFRDPKIAVISSENIPVANRTCLTTISSLYDTLRVLFKFEIRQTNDRGLRFNRPSDSRLEEHYQFALAYFAALASAFKPIGRLFDTPNPTKVTEKQRGPHGGNLLFRPLGLDVVTHVATELARYHNLDLAAAVQRMRDIPTDLASAPYRDVIWDAKRSRVIGRGKSLARDLLMYVVGLPVDKKKLADRYRLALGVGPGPRAKLPAFVV